MNFKHKLSLKITGVIFSFFVIFWLVFLFLFSDSLSVKELFNKLFIEKEIFWKSVEYFYSYLFFKTTFMLFWIYFISYYFVWKYLNHIEIYNKKLQDYNHYLAHELKTPISVVTSNLEVLQYWYDEEKIKNSKAELKNMTKIINWLLKFSETIQITNKTDINLENFINKNLYFLESSENIHITNNEFNYSIFTDEVLFSRVIKNLIENAIKYSIDKQVFITISDWILKIENNIYASLEQEEINKLCQKNYSRSYNENSWNWIWLGMISEIIKVLWYELNILSLDCKFIVEIDFE